MSHTIRGVRIGLLMAGAGLLLFWVAHHAEVSFADGLRYVREAELISRGNFAAGLIEAIDHPMHPLAIAAAHAVLGGSGPFAWQTAAQAAAVLALALAVIPLYLLAREIFDDDATAGIACVLVFANPLITYIAINVLSESTFLLFWLWGLWTAVRFLREGRFLWLPPAIGLGALAYLTRPEGLLLHGALVATLLLLPLNRLTRIYWPRWWAAVAVLVVGPAVLVGPYIALKGGIGTKPAVAQVLGTKPHAPASALEREQPLPPEQTTFQTYLIATSRMIKAYRGAITWPLIPFALLGLVVARPGQGRVRLWLFLGAIVAASAIGLIRLHATGGYCTVRHALVPGILFMIAAAHGLTWLVRAFAIDARWLRLGEGIIRPGPAVWGLIILAIIAWPLKRSGTRYQSSFAPYRQAGAWLAKLPEDDGRVLDMTDWSLFFSGRQGRGYDGVIEAAGRHETRWLVVREAHLTGHNHAAAIARGLVKDREPVAKFPERPTEVELQVLLYDLEAPRQIASRRNDTATVR